MTEKRKKKTKKEARRRARRGKESRPSLTVLCEEFYRLEGGVWSEKRLFSKNGRPLLSWEGQFPAPKDDLFQNVAAAERVREFYAREALLTARAVREKFLPAAERDFLALGEESRFRFRRFSLRHRIVALSDKGESVAVQRELLLTRGGKTLYRHIADECFSKVDGRPLLFRKETPHKKQKKTT